MKCGARIDDNLKDWEITTEAVTCQKMVVNKVKQDMNFLSKVENNLLNIGILLFKIKSLGSSVSKGSKTFNCRLPLHFFHLK